mmetsp:Transcript_39167/g.62746  ORF Transcript_39167/g.62746 Transcript_39167/m.62746 type:complete len:236 (+) Transcript_39167:22-729(+)
MEEAIKALEFEDENTGEPLKIISFKKLDEERAKLFRGSFEECKNGDIISVDCGSVEHIVVYDAGKAKPVVVECGITLAELSPTQLVEYCFEEKGPWMVSRCSLPALEAYRKMKFSQWKKAVTHPDCMASFRRVLKMGLVTSIFDHLAFPEPSEEEKKKWQVKNEAGKIIHIPHPVKALRIWNKSKGEYEAVRAHMEGAPEPKDAEKYWQDMLNDLRETRGTKLIDDVLATNLSET